MNKKFLVCGAIVTAILVTACVKKEEPKNESAEQTAASTVVQQPAQFENLESSETQNAEQQNTQTTNTTDVPAVPRVEVERTETANTTTEIRRTTGATEATTPPPAPKPAKAESVKAETQPTEHKINNEPKAPVKANTSTAQSEDDAVAAAIAAATPALKN